MSKWRDHNIRRVLAILAVVATVVHVGLTSWHFVMRAAPAVAQTLGTEGNLADKAWSTAIGGLICHGAGASDAADPSNSDGPAPALKSCPICTALHASVALAAPFDPVVAPVWSRPVAIKYLPQRAVIQLDAHPFQARGPPPLAA